MAIGAVAVSAASMAVTVTCVVVAHSALPRGYVQLVFAVVVPVSFAGVATLFIRHRPDHALGLVLAGIGATAGLLPAAEAYGRLSLVIRPGSLPGGEWAAWVSSWLWPVPVFSVVTFLPLLFLDGRLQTRLQRAAGSLAATSIITVCTAGAVNPAFVRAVAPIANPFPFASWDVSSALQRLGSVGVLVASVGSIAMLVRRWRRGDRAVRGQINSLLMAVVVAALAILLTAPFEGVIQVTAEIIYFPLVPAAVGAAVLRHRLLDLDRLVHRFAIWAVLSVAILAVYVIVVEIARRFVGDRAPNFSLIATVVVAIGLIPAHRGVNRRLGSFLYGARDEPARAASALARVASDADSSEAVLQAALTAAADSLFLPYLAIRVFSGEARDEASDLAAVGTEVETTEAVPLVFHGECFGELVAGTREHGRALTARDIATLQEVAAPLAAVARSTLLLRELQATRDRLVLTREEERRSLRRELHDDLGPILSGTRLTTDAARQLIAADPSRASALLESVDASLGVALENVRAIAATLRPPALDRFGLVAAVEHHVASVCPIGLDVAFEADHCADALPAAVETAAYRVAIEAITNIVRHAKAVHCSVTFQSDARWLEVEIDDDGSGIAATASPGVGTLSMQERTAELGGRLAIGASPTGGTRVTAAFPLA